MDYHDMDMTRSTGHDMSDAPLPKCFSLSQTFFFFKKRSDSVSLLFGGYLFTPKAYFS